MKYKLVTGQQEVAEAKDSLSKSAKFEVGLVESIAPVLRHFSLGSVEEDGGTTIKDALWSALHHEDILLRVSQLVN